MEIQPIFGVIKMESFVALILIAVSILGYCFYLDVQNDKAIDKRRKEEVALLNLKLEAELLVPRSKVKIETFDDIFYTNYFTAKIISRWCSNDYIYTSKDMAENNIKNSFEQGYFVTYDGIHIPIRVIKTAQIVN